MSTCWVFQYLRHLWPTAYLFMSKLLQEILILSFFKFLIWIYEHSWHSSNDCISSIYIQLIVLWDLLSGRSTVQHHCILIEWPNSWVGSTFLRSKMLTNSEDTLSILTLFSISPKQHEAYCWIDHMFFTWLVTIYFPILTYQMEFITCKNMWPSPTSLTWKFC